MVHRLRQFAGDAYDKYALRVGRISMAWNALHEEFYLLFTRLVPESEGQVARGIWHSVQNETAQRAFLRAAAIAGHDKRFIQSIEWMVKQTDKIGSERNALIHSAVLILGNPRKGTWDAHPSGAARDAHQKKLQQMPNERDWKRVEKNLLDLADYAACINLEQFLPWPDDWVKQRSWPRRPRLRGVEGSTKPRQPQRKRKTTRLKRQLLPSLP